MDLWQYIQDQLSWSFAEIAQCTREPSGCVSTVQFWVAIGTGTALIFGFVRWVTMKLHKTTIDDRLHRIEGGIAKGKDRRWSGDDCELVRAHRSLFTRPAFMTSCIQELSILLLSDVIDETIAALGTGTHYDAKGQLRGAFGDMHGYTHRGHRKNIGLIYELLQQLQWQLKDLDQFLRHCPGAHYPAREFVSAGLRKRTDQATWNALIGRCDRIDGERNNVIKLFNSMLQECGEVALPPIVPSSTQVSYQTTR
jgi:hypothetical protein